MPKRPGNTTSESCGQNRKEIQTPCQWALVCSQEHLSASRYQGDSLGAESLEISVGGDRPGQPRWTNRGTWVLGRYLQHDQDQNSH